MQWFLYEFLKRRFKFFSFFFTSNINVHTSSDKTEWHSNQCQSIFLLCQTDFTLPYCNHYSVFLGHTLKSTGLYVKYRLALFLRCSKPENKQLITAIFLNKRCFFLIFINIFFIKKIKRLNDIIGHGLLWFINVQYQNIYCIYKLYRMLLATKTDFYLFLKKIHKNSLKILK